MKLPFNAKKFCTWPTSHYVWNLGLARCCDVIPPGDVFNTDSMAYIRPERLHEGDIIWNHPTEMRKFLYWILPKIRTHFILVIGDSDATFPGEIFNSQELEALFSSEKLIHIFSQNGNYEGPHKEKFSNMPIGIDFHTLFLRPHGFEETYQTVEEQEITLNSIIAERKLGALCDFQLSPR